MKASIKTFKYSIKIPNTKKIFKIKIIYNFQFHYSATANILGPQLPFLHSVIFIFKDYFSHTGHGICSPSASIYIFIINIFHNITYYSQT